MATTAPQGTVPDEWKLDQLSDSMQEIFKIAIDKAAIENDSAISPELLRQRLGDQVIARRSERIAKYGEEAVRYIEKDIAMKTLDMAWRTHLVNLEHLRRGINLRAYAQKNPLNEYKFEAFNIFQEMLHKIKVDVLTTAYGFELQTEPEHSDEDRVHPIEVPRASKPVTSSADEQQISRNALCPCGSGKRYKHCHGVLKSEYVEDESSADNRLSPIEKPKAAANEDPAKVLHDYIKEQRQQILEGKPSDDEEQ